MSDACAIPATGNGFLAGMLQYFDCQAQTIGETGYQALASPGSSVSLALTALLTIFIALYGIRMLMGHVPSLGETMAGILKIGIVLALATSWAAYRVIAYETVLHGPAEIVEAIGSPSGLPGAEGGLVARLQWADDKIVALSASGTGRFDPVPTGQGGTSPANPAKYTPIGDDFALGLARVAYLGGTIGALAVVRLAAGLMLALAPLFAGFLLFESTRSFFMGWARMLVASALGALVVTVVLGVELGILEPWLANVLALRAAHYATPSAPTELLVITLAFDVALFGMIAIGMRIAFVAHAPGWLRERSARIADEVRRWSGNQSLPDAIRQDQALVSRAHNIAGAVASVQRREATIESDRTHRRAADSATSSMGGARDGHATSFIPIGQNYRRTIRRVSASTNRRSGTV